MDIFENIRFSSFGRWVNNIDIEILEHGYLTADSTWKHYNVNSTFNRLYFIADGSGYIENKGDRTELKPGNVYLIPLHTTCNYICDERLVKFYIHFRADILSSFDIFQDTGRCLMRPYETTKTRYLVKTAAANEISSIFQCKSIIYSVLSDFIPQLEDISAHKLELSCKYMQLNQFIAKNCSAQLTLDAVAAHLGTKKSSLSRQFRKDMGLTLKRYIDLNLLRTVKEKLLVTDQNIRQISIQYNFSDEFYFSRFFKKYTGMSPKDFRKKNRFL
jgi:AraC-like DNA-binding protein